MIRYTPAVLAAAVLAPAIAEAEACYLAACCCSAARYGLSFVEWVALPKA